MSKYPPNRISGLIRAKGKSYEERYGLKKSLEVKEKMRLAKLGKKRPFKSRISKGDKHYNWKGGITRTEHLCRQMSEYKHWRSQVFERDGWQCQTCQARGYVTAHHIIGFALIIRAFDIQNIDDARKCPQMWDISNGVTLCEECHKLTDNYKGREKLIS